MPVVTVFETLNAIYFAKFKGEKTTSSSVVYEAPEQFIYPHSYSNFLISETISKKDYYNEVFLLAQKELSLKKNDKYIFANLFSQPEIPVKDVTNVSLISSIENNVFYLSNLFYSLGDNISCITPLINLTANLDFISNTWLYPDTQTNDLHTQVAFDQILRDLIKLVPPNLNVEKNTDILFTGDRIAKFNTFPELTTLLILDFLSNPGVYQIKIDSQNTYIHKKMYEGCQYETISLGTVVNTPGDTECLFKTELDTQQLIQLKKDTIFALPLEANMSAALLIKNQNGQFEQEVFGGQVGVVFDTRVRDNNQTDFSEVYLDLLGDAFNKLEL